MILSPAIIALMTGLFLLVAMTMSSSCISIRIIRDWDIKSGSEAQLALERKTHLISTVLVFVMCFELFSLFLFIYTVDHIHHLFVGAMCAAGTLNVNAYGYSTLVVKMLSFCLCGLWLILNNTDNQAYDYPLIKSKYKFLLFITGMVLLEAFLQFNYFMLMEPNLITSCCGALFSEGSQSIAGDMAALPVRPVKIALYASVLLTLRTGAYCCVKGKGYRLFAWCSGWLLALSIAAVISFIAVYFYELPSHHCPFCLLQKEYYYIGYPLYLSLFGAGIAGVGAGMLDRFKHVPSLSRIIPRAQRRLCLASMAGFLVFTAIATYPLLFSGFILEGY